MTLLIRSRGTPPITSVKDMKLVTPSYAVRVHQYNHCYKIVSPKRQTRVYWCPTPMESIKELNSRGYMTR